MTFGGNESSTGCAESAFPVVDCLLHLRYEVGARVVRTGSSMHEVGVIHKGVAYKGDCSASQSRGEGSAVACSPHHVDNGGADDCPASGAGTIALSEALERNVSSGEGLGGNSEGGPDEVL